MALLPFAVTGFNEAFLNALNANFAALDSISLMTFAQLRGLPNTTLLDSVMIAAKATPNDGFGGIFAYDNTDTTTADDDTNTLVQTSTNRRYKRVTPIDANTTVSVATIAQLKALTTRPMIVYTRGYYVADDGGGGPRWQWVAGSTATADDIFCVQPTSGTPGRYMRVMIGNAVDAKWAGCGLGVLDDSPQLQKLIDSTLGYSIFLSRGTYPVKGLTVTNASLCPGIFSDGSATLVPAPGSTTATIGFTVSKITNGFFFRGLKAVMPIAVDSVTAPAYDRMFWFTTLVQADVGVDWEVSDCSITGGKFGIVVGGQARNLKILRNYLKGCWSDGISGPSASNSTFIQDNTLEDGGAATGGPQAAGAIRIHNGTYPITGVQVSITNNHIARWAVPSDQSAIDCFSGAAYNIDVSNNVVDECGAGIEFKCAPVAGGTPAADIYAHITCSGNTIYMRPSTFFAGVSIFHASGDEPIEKAHHFLVSNNQISCRTKGDVSTGPIGVTISGYTNVSIKGNKFSDLRLGVQLSGTNGSTTDYSLDIDITGNTMDVMTTGILSGSDSVKRLVVSGNYIRAVTQTAIALNSGTFQNVSIENNYLWCVNRYGIELRANATQAVIRDNTIKGGINAILSQSTAPDDITITQNRLITAWNTLPAVSGTVTNPGAGLTNGTRTFTVTSGTGTVQCRFSCVVAGGVITGPVVIIEGGSYNSGAFPTVPTVTVDSGVVGGATFNLTAAVPSSAIAWGTGTNTRIFRNSVDVGLANRTITGAGTYQANDNVRGMNNADPSATFAGAIGDVVINSAPAAAGVMQWVCTTAGNAGAATFKACAIAA